MSKIYSINELYGYAWECAIDNVRNIIDKRLSFYSIENLAIKLKLRFDENGEII